MILTSLLCCNLSSVLLVVMADTNEDLLFLGTGAVGFFVSLQFASGYSWLAEQVDLTGRGSSVVFLGANFGWLVFPPLAGLVFFSSVGPMGVYYLTLGLCMAHLILFLGMDRFSSSNS
jgi:fucose permease